MAFLNSVLQNKTHSEKALGKGLFSGGLIGPRESTRAG